MNTSRQAASVSPALSFTSFVIDIYINSPPGLYSTTVPAQSVLPLPQTGCRGTCWRCALRVRISEEFRADVEDGWQRLFTKKRASERCPFTFKHCPMFQ